MGTLTCHPFWMPEQTSTGPLQVLAERLTLGPPSIAQLIAIIENSEVVQEFLALVREYLPEYEREIMVQDDYERMETFCRRFGERYFPLAESPFGWEELEQLVYCIPIGLGGLTYDDYHEFQQFRVGHILMQSLVIYPYTLVADEEWGARVPLLEEVKNTVGEELAKRIPAEGWDPILLHKILDGTRFEGAADFADWVCSCTDCWTLDANYEDFMEEPWSRENVDELTRQWPRVQEITDRMNHMTDWLDDKPQANFAELLDFITREARAMGCGVVDLRGGKSD